MAAFAAFLRGINIAGHHPVPMAELRALLAELGYEEPRTLLQSGNAVFRGRAASTAAVERRLEPAIARRFGFAVDCHVRSAADWSRLVAANPFGAEARRDPGRLVLVLLRRSPAPAAVAARRAAIRGPEVVRPGDRVLWAYYPEGQGRSKLTLPIIEKALGASGTGRNWNTVVKVSQLLEE